jgi:uncharacterized repeat protein (TIGR02543 family)
MPNNAVTIIANFEPIPITTHRITIHGGTANPYPEAAADTVVTVTAENRPGYVFTHWSGANFVNYNSPTATFVMPGSAITVTANFIPYVPAFVPVTALQVMLAHPGGTAVAHNPALPITSSATYNLSAVPTPANATNSAVVWSIYPAAPQIATILNNVLTTHGPGTINLRATVANGTAVGTNFVHNVAVVVVEQ